MKRLYHLQIGLLFIALSALNQEVTAQCSGWFTTYSYLCDNDSILLEAIPTSGTGPFTYLWETGETTKMIIIPHALGDYMVTITDATGCTAIFNCHVKYFPQIFFEPWQTEACEGEDVLLYIDWYRDTLPGLLYEWSTGETTESIWVDDDITYSVTMTDPLSGCSVVAGPYTIEFHEVPDPQIIGPTEICDNQTITLSLEPGDYGNITWYPDYEYSDTYVVTEPGTYWVYVTNIYNTWCSAYDTIVITEGYIPPPILAGPPDLCDTQTGTIEVTNNTLYEEFLWSNGETDFSFEVTQPGTYTVTVTEDTGCTAEAEITVENATENELTLDATTATCGESNGSLDLSYSLSGSYDYIWSNGATSQDLDNVPSGVYSVTVTASDGCYTTMEGTVPETPIDITLNETVTPNSSCTEFNGAIDLFVSPDGAYSYQWSTGATTQDIEDLYPGVYYVTVSLGNTCSTSDNFVVNDISAAPDVSYSFIPGTCGETNGSIDISLSGGTSPFVFEWSSGQTTEDLENIPAGTFSLTVTAADGCTAIAVIDLPNENPPITLNGVITQNTSCTGANGAIDITPSPDNNYDYNWSTGASSQDITGLGAGTYIVTVTFGAACSEVDTFVVGSESLPFDVSGSATPNSSCNAPNGLVDLTVSPAGSYTYTWSNGGNSEDIQNLGGGSYVVTVTSTDGCAITSIFTIDNLSSPINLSGLTIANTSCQVPNGMIDISVTPAGAYLYSWSTGATTEDLQGVAQGTYTVTVSDANGCMADSSFTVDNQSAGFTLSAVPTENTSCTAPNGSLDLTVSPSGAYTFIWSNGAVSEDVQLLDEGAYSVTVTDGNSCSSTSVFSVTSNTNKPVITSSITNEVCGAGNASIDLSTTPAGNTFLWSDGATTEDLSNLSADTFVVIVTAVNGCTATDTFTITNSSNNFTLSASPVDNSSCTSPNGAIDLTVNPAGSYTFLWSTGATSEDLQNLVEGTYTVTVIDNQNCSSTSSFTILSNTVNPVISEVISPATCGNANGKIELSVTPANGNTFLWSNGASTKDMVDLAGGIYSITVTASNGCTSTASFIVPENNSNFTVIGTTSDNVSCIAANGSIDLTTTPSGTYTYNWSNGSTTSDLQNLNGGTYVVTITDQFNCASTQQFIVADNTINPVVTSAISPASCGQPNGAIDISVSLTINNSFAWSNGNTGEDMTSVLPGTYQVTVTSDNGCSSVLTIDVPNQNSNFSIASSLTDDQSCINAAGSINLTVTPIGSYTFLWSNGVTSEDLMNIESGIYSVTVTDNFNCSGTDMFTIEDITSIPLVSEILTQESCGSGNGSIDLTVMPAGANTFIWSTGDTSEDLIDIPAGVYSVTVTDNYGCTTESGFNLLGSLPLEISIDADLNGVVTGDVVTCTLNVNVAPEMIDSIFWFPADLIDCHDAKCFQQQFTIVESTEISVLVIDTNGCMASAKLMLRADTDFEVYIPNIFTPNDNGPNDRFTVFANDEVEEVVELEIFDRWGNCVFINENFPPNEPAFGWDGDFKGTPMNPAVYAYRTVVKYSNGEQHAFRGDVTLVR